MLVTETPDNLPVSRQVTVNLTYMGSDLKPIEQKSVTARTRGARPWSASLPRRKLWP